MIYEKEQRDILAIIEKMHHGASSRVPLSLSGSKPFIPSRPEFIGMQEGLLHFHPPSQA